MITVFRSTMEDLVRPCREKNYDKGRSRTEEPARQKKI